MKTGKEKKMNENEKETKGENHRQQYIRKDKEKCLINKRRETQNKGMNKKEREKHEHKTEGNK